MMNQWYLLLIIGAAVILGTFMTNFVSSSSVVIDSEFLAVVKKAAGYYVDDARSKELNLEKTIIVTAVNFAYHHHLHNFKCFLDRLGLKFFVLSLDPHIHNYASKRGFLSYYNMDNENDTIGEDMTSFRNTKFNIITRYKKKIVTNILHLGYDVLFSDTDVVIVRDPISYLRFANVDYVHSVNVLCPFVKFSYNHNSHEGNTGFYFMRSTPASIKIMNQAADQFLKYPDLDDQVVFWLHFIKHVKYPLVMMLDTCKATAIEDIQNFREKHHSKNSSAEIFTICPLDECSFAAGTLHRIDKRIAALDPRGNITYVTIHANYIMNHEKMNNLKARGLWLATHGTKVADDTFKSESSGKSKKPADSMYWDGNCSRLDVFDTGKAAFDVFPIPMVDNTTIKQGGAREVYLMRNNIKCPVGGLETFYKLGLDFDDTLTLGNYEFSQYPLCPEGVVS